ncbi:MAG: hypothetical protein ABGZ53_03070 [Fuerstiella sp.]
MNLRRALPNRFGRAVWTVPYGTILAFGGGTADGIWVNTGTNGKGCFGAK